MLYVAGATIIVAALLYFEYVALLYVIGTLAVTALLVVVAFADLEGAKQMTGNSSAPAADDASAVGSGVTSTEASPTSPASSSASRLKKRKVS